MLTDIYNRMMQRNLTRSQRHFSQAWCGRAANYMADQNSDNMSEATALELMRRLVKAGHRDLAQTVLNSLIVLPAADSTAHRRDAADQPNRS
jgi:hypothetical protein